MSYCNLMTSNVSRFWSVASPAMEHCGHVPPFDFQQ